MRRLRSASGSLPCSFVRAITHAIMPRQLAALFVERKLRFAKMSRLTKIGSAVEELQRRYGPVRDPKPQVGPICARAFGLVKPLDL